MYFKGFPVPYFINSNIVRVISSRFTVPGSLVWAYAVVTLNTLFLDSSLKKFWLKFRKADLLQTSKF